VRTPNWAKRACAPQLHERILHEICWQRFQRLNADASMLKTSAVVAFRFASQEEAKAWIAEGARAQSVIGHGDTASLVGSLLGGEFPMNRISITLAEGDELLLAQYSGPRLLEGATSLPEGAHIQWIIVSVGT